MGKENIASSSRVIAEEAVYQLYCESKIDTSVTARRPQCLGHLERTYEINEDVEIDNRLKKSFKQGDMEEINATLAFRNCDCKDCYMV